MALGCWEWWGDRPGEKGTAEEEDIFSIRTETSIWSPPPGRQGAVKVGKRGQSHPGETEEVGLVDVSRTLDIETGPFT